MKWICFLVIFSNLLILYFTVNFMIVEFRAVQIIYKGLQAKEDLTFYQDVKTNTISRIYKGVQNIKETKRQKEMDSYGHSKIISSPLRIIPFKIRYSFLLRIINCRKMQHFCAEVYPQKISSRNNKYYVSDTLLKCNQWNVMCLQFSLNDPQVYYNILPLVLAKTNNLETRIQTENNPGFNENLGSSFASKNMQNNESLRKIKRRESVFQKTAKRSKRDLPSSEDREVCITSFLPSNVVGISRYLHSATGEMVSLYVYQGVSETNCSYRQIFRIASCSLSPLTLNIEGRLFACRESQTDVLATIVITASQMATGRFRNCHPISLHSNSHHFLCRDWIRVTTHCKLYYRDAS